MIRIGTAGWHYEDWNGVVYPKPRPRGFDPLTMLGGVFDTIEINATFYRIPSPGAAAGWVARVADNERFRFTAKLPQSFTHELGASRHAPSPAPDLRPLGDPDGEERLFREAMAPIIEAGRLGALLIQFPQSFHAGPQESAYLDGLLARFGDLPLVVEFRHAGWESPGTIELLRRRGAGFCNIDQPRLGSTLPPTAHVTGPVAYVRFHGRNAAAWFAGARSVGTARQANGQGDAEEEDDGGSDVDDSVDRRARPRARRGRMSARRASTRSRDRRYDYLYTERELAPWLGSIRQIAEEGADTYVITNNHFRGKAAVNALQIRAALEGGLVPVPDPLRAAYPELEAIAQPPEGRLPF